MHIILYSIDSYKNPWNTLEYTCSSRGALQICLDGYVFQKNKQLLNDTTSWRCCQARAYGYDYKFNLFKWFN